MGDEEQTVPNDRVILFRDPDAQMINSPHHVQLQWGKHAGGAMDVNPDSGGRRGIQWGPTIQSGPSPAHPSADGNGHVPWRRRVPSGRPQAGMAAGVEFFCESPPAPPIRCRHLLFNGLQWIACVISDCRGGDIREVHKKALAHGHRCSDMVSRANKQEET